MLERRSLKWPIGLGVVMILIVVILIVGWVVLSLAGALQGTQSARFFWVLLPIGSALLAFILAGVIMYLTLSVRAINLSRRQSNFIDSVTHELKSPIASLKLYLQTLTRRPVSEQQRADFHQIMLEDVDRLDQLIDHLLDAARIDRNARRPDEDCRLDEILATVVEGVAVRHRIPRESLRLDTMPALVKAPPLDLAIIFRNLIDNAVKYGGQPPEVDIILRSAPGGRISVRVSDNGAGIPHGLRRQIFGRFIRLGNELERSRQGTGLGLYLVRTLVRQLAGSIKVRDRRNGPGSEFEVQLAGELQVCDRHSDSLEDS
jgi:two-component system, OmpR family, phosphate regulon sensor histidine kinase PhoR